ncbi:MAG TPA: hypothetical protein VEP91_00980 [Solirubrobacterales bacterium]|nr:hypothetical protein [Solirubrobacterales bacterium]
MDREVLVEIALPGNAAFQNDFFAETDIEAQAGRFAEFRLEVVQGDSGSFGCLGRDHKPARQEGPGGCRIRDGIVSVDHQPRFVAADDRARIAFGDVTHLSTGTGDFTDGFEIFFRALGAALGILGESHRQIDALRFQHTAFVGFDQRFDHPRHGGFMPDDVLVERERRMTACLGEKQFRRFRRAERFGRVRFGRVFFDLIFVADTRLESVCGRRWFMLRFDHVAGIGCHHGRESKKHPETQKKQCERALAHQFPPRFSLNEDAPCSAPRTALPLKTLHIGNSDSSDCGSYYLSNRVTKP